MQGHSKRKSAGANTLAARVLAPPGRGAKEMRKAVAALWWHKLLASVLAVIAIALAVVYLLLLRDGGGQAVGGAVEGPVQFSYPNAWREQTLTVADTRAGLLVKLERSDPEASFLARTIVGRLEENFDMDNLSSATEAALKAEIENFALLDNRVLTIGPFEVVRVSYLDSGEEPKTKYQTLLLVVPTQRQTFFLTFRARQGDYQKIEGDVQQITANFLDFLNAKVPR